MPLRGITCICLCCFDVAISSRNAPFDYVAVAAPPATAMGASGLISIHVGEIALLVIFNSPTKVGAIEISRMMGLLISEWFACTKPALLSTFDTENPYIVKTRRTMGSKIIAHHAEPRATAREASVKI